MKFNLYIPDTKTKKRWQRYARYSQRTLSQFIRLAVEEKIRQIEEEELR